jgi:DNA-binding HxlR family transcriptional regulator
MAQGSYQQFCPVSMAAEVLCTRWTIVLLRELICGSTRFNDLRRGVPRMSPALLSQRLKDLEAHGVIRRLPSKEDPSVFEYHLTRAGEELRPIIEGFGVWGQRWIDKDVSMQNLDAQLLMWDMRRKIAPNPMPKRKSVIQFLYPEQAPLNRNWWLIVKPKEDVELCWVDPGFDVDLYCASDLRTMTEIWMGHDTIAKAVEQDRLKITGDKELARNMEAWMGFSVFAKEKSQMAS